MSVSDLVVVIPSKRPPPLLTFRSYEDQLKDHPVILVSDPEFYRDHMDYYGSIDGVTVVTGGIGVGQQIAACYRWAAIKKFEYWAKLDDDLTPNTFVGKGYDPDLTDVLEETLNCMLTTNTTLAGIQNSTNEGWMGEGYKRTWGLIHGGFNVSISTLEPQKFICTQLRRNGDVWRTCAHRKHSGAVGRVGFIGFNKKDSTMNSTTIPDDQDSIDLAKRLIVEAFPEMVECKGTMMVHGKEFPNWRMKRGPHRP